LNIPVNLISNWKWNSRRKKENENEEEFAELCRSIKQNGLINAITVVQEEGKYKVIAGRRRLAAHRKLGLDTITAFIKTDLPKDVDKKIITNNENEIRKQHDNVDSAYSWLDIYEAAGYTPEQAMKGNKWIHNNQITAENIFNGYEIDDDNSSHQVAKLGEPNNKAGRPAEYIPDKKFIEISKRICKAANTQYQHFQWVVQLQEDVLEYANEKGLSSKKKVLLTTSSLLQHPKLQKELVDEIKEYEFETAQVRVQQVASDIDQGYIEKVGKDTYIDHIGKEREKVTKKGKVLKPPNVRILNIHAALNKTLYQLTDHVLNRREHEYTENMILYSKGYRMELVKGLNDKYLAGLEETLGLIKSVTDELLQSIEREHSDREKKMEMMGK